AGRAAAQEPTVVVLVRHAEKAAAGGQDPELSPEGAARAAALAEALADAGVDAVVTTQLRRTRLTAEPLARALGLTPEAVPTTGGGEAHVRAVADAVRRHSGKTVLVVGHSNTVPAIVGALGGPALDELCEHEYGNLFVMVLRPGGEPSLLRTRFGAPDPAPAAPCTRSMRQE
ncbi:MAG TPA: phosphoglycerate mutase family protein, partial [Longimicrobiaceae bacterium]|nr:phosphoglycerate mutase family protein [Longimicrobiaceae bacterium]